MPASLPTPWLRPHERLDGRRTRELITEVRRLGGEEMLVRRFKDEASAGPAATRMRKTLGTDFYVIRRGPELWVRARRSGEPELKLRRLRMGEDWLSVKAAAAALGMTEQWLRSQYVRTGRLPKYTFGRRVVFRTDDVQALQKELAPGGAVVGRLGEHGKDIDEL